MQDLQLNFASSGRKQSNPRHVFNVFLSFNEIDKTLNQFLRRLILTHATITNIVTSATPGFLFKFSFVHGRLFDVLLVVTHGNSKFRHGTKCS